MPSPATDESKKGKSPAKDERSFFLRYGPICYLSAILIGILIVFIIVWLCGYFFCPPQPRLTGLFAEGGTAALRAFSAGSVDCAR